MRRASFFVWRIAVIPGMEFEFPILAEKLWLRRVHVPGKNFLLCRMYLRPGTDELQAPCDLETPALNSLQSSFPWWNIHPNSDSLAAS